MTMLVLGIIIGVGSAGYILSFYKDPIMAVLIGLTICASVTATYVQGEQYKKLQVQFKVQSELLDKANDSNFKLLSKLTDKTVQELWDMADKMEVEE